MSCQAYQSQLEAYVDGALAPAARADVEAHLAGCTECTREARREARLLEVLGALPVHEPTPSLATRFSQRLEAEAAPRPGLLERLFGGRRAWAAFAVGAAAAAVVAFVVWPRGETPLPPGPGRQPAVVAVKAPPTELLRDLDLVRNLDAVAHLELVEGLTAEEFEAVAKMPQLGG